MANDMKASLVLTLQDKLSSPLDRFKNQFEQLKRLGSGLGLGKLENAGDVLRGIVNDARGVVSGLRGIENVAERGYARIKKMGVAAREFGQHAITWGKNTFGPEGKVGALQGALAGYSIYGPLESAAQLSNTLSHSAITAHQYGPDADRMMAAQRSLYTKTALDTAQGSHEIAEAGFWMALTGMNTKLVEKLSPLSAKIATAYNTAVIDAAKTAFGLNYSMKIDEPDMERALGMMAILGKHGHYLFADQAKSIPMVAAAAQMSHMTGMASLEQIGAAMQISMKVVDPSQPAMAATNLEQFLRQIQSAREDKVFEKYGVNIGKVLMDAAGKGVSPLEASLDTIEKIQAREIKRQHLTNPAMRDQSDTEVLNHLLRSLEASRFASAMLHNKPEYVYLKGIAHNVNSGEIGQDFTEAMRNLNSEMKLFHEETTQIVDRMGFGFAPVLRLVNRGLQTMIHGLDWLDKKFPGLGEGVLAVVGGLLMLTAAFTAIAFVWPALVAGFQMIAGLVGLLVTPLGLVAVGIAALAVAGLEIYRNWDTVQPVIERAGNAFDSFVGSVMRNGHSLLMRGLWGISDAWDAMAAAAGRSWTAIDKDWGITPKFDEALRTIGDAWDWMATAAGRAWTEIDKYFAITPKLDALKGLFSEMGREAGKHSGSSTTSPAAD